MRSLVLLILGGVIGFGINGFFDHFGSTKLIVLERNVGGGDGMILPKGTILTYVNEMPEGYLMANLNVAIEGEALLSIKTQLEERSSLRHQYFFYYNTE